MSNRRKPGTRQKRKGTLRALRKRSESIATRITHLHTVKAQLDAEMQKLTAQLSEEHARAAIHGKVARSAHRDKQWDRAIKWAKHERKKDEYVTYLALKHLPTAKKGQASYEFAFYEAANRGEAFCGRGRVGTHLCDAPRNATAGTPSGSRSYSQFRAQLLALFPTDPQSAESFTRKFNAFVEYDKAGKEKDGSPNIDDAVTYLIRAAGFTEV